MITCLNCRSQLSVTNFLLIVLSFCITPLVIAEEDQIFGAWSLICTDGGNKFPRYSTISQKVSTDPAGLKVVMGVSVHFPPDSQLAIMDIRITPHAIIDAGIGFKVDQHDGFKLRIKECTKDICVASGRLKTAILEQLISGKMVQVGFFIRPKKQITAPISLDGFNKAYISLKNTQRN